MIEAASSAGPRRLPGKLFANLADAFLLRDAEAWARKLPETDRQTLTYQVARARQKLESARLLWAHEQYVEGLRLAEESVVEALRAAEEARGVLTGEAPDLRPSFTGAPPWADVLTALGANSDDIQDAIVVMGGPVGHKPTWNGDLRPENRRYFRSATRVAEGVLEWLAPLTAAPRRIVTSRWLRVGGIAVVVLAFVATFFYVRGSVSVAASGSFNDYEFEPRKAIDGNPKTEWLLPSKSTGWLELSFRARSIKLVKLLNARNPPFLDRATQDFRVELYRNKQLVHSAKQKFEKLEADPAWLPVPIPAITADAVRIVIDSSHKSGGGLAEVVVE
jgi:hypothetical protein